MEKNPKLDFQLPPGFRFHPSDEELIVHYLRKKATKTPLPASIIAEVELYKLNPWDLPKKSLFGDEEWYFFTPRDRKYPNGMRPNRMAASGYWKATGIDKPIVTSYGSKVIGVKKALVFYTGRPPRGNKTDWIMHEYRLPEPDVSWYNKKEKSMRLDEWVLCRVRQKKGMPFGNFPENQNGPSSNITVQQQPKLDKQCSTEAAPNFDMVRDYLYKDCPLPFLFDSQDFPSTETAVSCISFEGNNKASSSACEDNFNIDYLQSSTTPSYLRKRKLFGQGNGKDQDNFGHPNKKATNRDYQKEEQQLPPLFSENDYADHSAMISYTRNQSDKNNYLDQLCPSMMYEELYSFAFT